MKRYWLAICLIFLVTVFAVCEARGDKEPNNDFEHAEKIGEGTVDGEVDAAQSGQLTDVDYYKVTVPAHATLRVTLRYTGSPKIYELRIYDSDGNNLTFSNGKERLSLYLADKVTGEWRNSDDTDEDVYINVSGDGKYELTIEINRNNDANNYFWTGVYCLVVIIIIIVVVVIAVVLYIRNRKRHQATQQYFPQYPPQESQQYPPQQQNQYPPPPPPQQ